ncbi:MAG: hypothetical protein QG597_3199, partial [Actinomycetota bacterium]|nr:hypothetical protein [Actinomycetota bacterium]
HRSRRTAGLGGTTAACWPGQRGRSRHIGRCRALGPLNHCEVIASILKPFVSEANYWTLEHHPLFQTYFYGGQVGIDLNGRDVYRDSPYFERTAEFCGLYDEVSFDPDYPNEPRATFEPMVRRVLAKPPSSSTS